MTGDFEGLFWDDHVDGGGAAANGCAFGAIAQALIRYQYVPIFLSIH